MISIIIPICNTDYPPAHYTGNCIGSVKYFTKNMDYELIIIDNNSTVELGGLDWKRVADQYVKNKENVGVPKAWNQGIKRAGGKYVCIMNSDVQVYDFWDLDMVEALEHVDLVQATPMYEQPYGRAREARDKREDWMYVGSDKYLSDFRDFSCFMIKKETIDEIGLFDEKYGMGYGEDVDYAFRLQENGKTLKSNKRVNTHHVGMATGHTLGGQGFELGKEMDRNREYTKKKWGLDKYGIPKFMREGNNA